MTERNGDKARYHKQRKAALKRRAKIRALLKARSEAAAPKAGTKS